MRTLLSIAILGLAACQPLGSREATPPHYDIGVVARRVSTHSPEAQLWFDRGLALNFGFNHEEAIACFERAAELDPELAMAHWGKAYALGTNYNSPAMTPEASQAAYEALQQALARLEGASPVERDLVLALRARYAWPAPDDRAELERAYAAAMRQVHAAHPDDPEVTALLAEALMQVRPWKLWSHEGVPAPELPEIRRVLEAGLARWPDHPALCHLYIHAMEASPEVELALPYARRLERLVPGAGHLVHMPSHIYTWTGLYDDVIRVNLAAVEADRAYVAHAGRHNVFTLYRVHNLHFIAYGGMFDGRRELALSAAREIQSEIPRELHAEMADLTDVFVATPYHVMVRFGMWEELLREPEPAPELLATRAVWHYARGIALASLGRTEEAASEQARFRAAKAAVPPTRLLFQNEVVRVLEVADHVLAGELEYRRGNHERAFELLRQAVALDERLNYDEPWGWMEPARHALGALLVDQGRHAEALAVYERDLERYPENGWALFGLAECLTGLGREREAADVRRRFERAWARADVEIPGSCFCRVRPGARVLEAASGAGR
jgi:tetratricopeptide (TPR) repeat protein